MVADAGMLSEANLAAIEDAGLRFIVAARIPEIPYQVRAWRRRHPDEPIEDGQIFTQPWVGGPRRIRRRTIFYQYRADRARRTLKGIDQQIGKAEKAVAGRPRSNGTGSSSSLAAPAASTVTWKPRPEPWPG